MTTKAKRSDVLIIAGLAGTAGVLIALVERARDEQVQGSAPTIGGDLTQYVLDPIVRSVKWWGNTLYDVVLRPWADLIGTPQGPETLNPSRPYPSNPIPPGGSANDEIHRYLDAR